MEKRLMIIVPCYNEEEVLPITIPKMLSTVNDLISKGLIAENSRCVFVNDGSKDETWNIIRTAVNADKHVVGIDLSGNTGHQNALVAGLEYAKNICDITVSIDADLQDDISAIEEMILKYNAGNDVVFGVRSNRKKDSLFKRATAQGFYRVMSYMGVNIVYNHADYRLLSKRALCALLEYKEQNLFLRGIAAKIGFNSDVVYYARAERAAGESKYPFKKMISFAWDGITSFSIKPINFLMSFGLAVTVLAAAAFVYTFISALRGNEIRDYVLLMISVWFIGGVQMLSTGLVGQYAGKAYMESKRRPKYHIKEILGNE